MLVRGILESASRCHTSRVGCHMPGLVDLNGFLDPVAISADIGVDSWLFLGPTRNATPRHKASETVSTH